MKLLLPLLVALTSTYSEKQPPLTIDSQKEQTALSLPVSGYARSGGQAFSFVGDRMPDGIDQQDYQSMVLRPFDLNNEEQWRDAPLHRAAIINDLKKVDALLKAGANVHTHDMQGYVPLHYAAVMNHTEVVDALLKAAADVNAEDRLGRTALHLVALQGHLEPLELLLNAGANPDKADHTKAQGAALHYAAAGNHVKIVDALLKAGANPHKGDVWGNTALSYAGRLGHVEVMKLFFIQGKSKPLQQEAKINVRNQDRWAPLPIAKKEGAQIVDRTTLSHNLGARPLALNHRSIKQSPTDMLSTCYTPLGLLLLFSTAILYLLLEDHAHYFGYPPQASKKKKKKKAHTRKPKSLWQTMRLRCARCSCQSCTYRLKKWLHDRCGRCQCRPVTFKALKKEAKVIHALLGSYKDLLREFQGYALDLINYAQQLYFACKVTAFHHMLSTGKESDALHYIRANARYLGYTVFIKELSRYAEPVMHCVLMNKKLSHSTKKEIIALLFEKGVPDQKYPVFVGQNDLTASELVTLLDTPILKNRTHDPEGKPCQKEKSSMLHLCKILRDPPLPSRCSYPACPHRKKAPKLYSCRGCLNARYCSKACAKRHWKEHKPACKETLRYQFIKQGKCPKLSKEWCDLHTTNFI